MSWSSELSQEQSACPFAGDRQCARNEAVIRSGPTRPFDPFRPCAIGEILTDDIVPHAEKGRIDAGSSGEHWIEHAIGDFADLSDALRTSH